MMYLNNYACQEAGFCLESCGMCEDPQNRKLSPLSLFGVCRELGYCIAECGVCAKIAQGSKYDNISRRKSRGTAQVGPKHRVLRHGEGCFDPLTQELLCTSQQRYCIIE